MPGSPGVERGYRPHEGPIPGAEVRRDQEMLQCTWPPQTPWQQNSFQALAAATMLHSRAVSDCRQGCEVCGNQA